MQNYPSLETTFDHYISVYWKQYLNVSGPLAISAPAPVVRTLSVNVFRHSRFLNPVVNIYWIIF